MKYTIIRLVPVLALVFLISCQKEVSSDQIASGGGSTSQSIIGNYKFISMTASTYSAVDVALPGNEEKDITISNYITKDNTGTIAITASTFASNNVGYSIDTIANVYTYINGSLFDSTQMPFQFAVPPGSSTASYKTVGSDSLYFTSGSAVSGGTTQQTQASGGRWKWNGNLLYMTFRTSQTSSQTVQGTQAVTTDTAYVVYTLQKM